MPQTTLNGFFKPVGLTIPAVVEESPEPGCLIARLEGESPSQKDDSLPFSSSAILSQATLLSHTGVAADAFIPQQCPKATIVCVQRDHLPALKHLTATLFPVRYSDKFFEECVHDQIVSKVCRVVLWEGKPVGWIRCHLQPGRDETQVLYIQALGVLAPYRGQGLASLLLDRVTTKATSSGLGLSTISAHVWEANEDALGWYEKRNFRRTELVKQYYRRLKPSAAWMVVKQLE